MIMGLDVPTSGTALVNGQTLSEMRWPLREVGALLDAKAFAVAADPTLTSGPPEREPPPPTLDFAPLDAAIARLTAFAFYYTIFALFAVGARLLADPLKLKRPAGWIDRKPVSSLLGDAHEQF